MNELRVERCPGCGARYNVTRLVPGTRFACRRCGGAVAVGLAAGAADGDAVARPRLRLAMLAAGLTLLVAIALRSIPGDVAGTPGAAWSAALSSLDLADTAALALAAVVGGFALVAAAPSTPRGVLLALAGGAIAVVTLAHGPSARVLRLSGPDPATAVALALLGGGALALASERAGARSTARPLVLAGVLLLLASSASRFVDGSLGSRSLVFARSSEAAAFLARVWRGTPTTDALGSAWTGAIPDLLTAAAALALVLVVAWPARSGGRGSRGIARAAFFLLLCAHATGTAEALWDVRAQWLGDGGARLVAAQLASLAFDAGLALWLLGSALLAALGERRGGTPHAPAGSGAFHLLAAAAAVGALGLLVNPATGVFAPGDARAAEPLLETLRAAPLALLHARATPQEVVVGLLGLLALVTLTTTLVAPLRRHGALVAAVAAAAACAFDLATYTGSPMRLALPALAVAAAGATWARRGPRWDGRGRGVVVVAAVALALLLLFPERGAGDDAAHLLPYPSALATMVDALADVRGSTAGALAASTVVAPTLLAATALVLALAAALLGPRRALGVGLVLVALALALHGPVAAFLATLGEARTPGSSPPLAEALAAAGVALRALPTPALLAGLAAAADAAGGRTQPI